MGNEANNMEIICQMKDMDGESEDFLGPKSIYDLIKRENPVSE